MAFPSKFFVDDVTVTDGDVVVPPTPVMPSQLIKGYITAAQTIPKSAPLTTIDMSAARTGSQVEVNDFIFFFLSASGATAASNTPDPPAGWSTIVPWKAMGTSTSTMWGLFAKRRLAGETNYDLPQINTGRTNNVILNVFWIDGDDAAPIANWIVGTLTTRAASGGTVNTNAAAVTTTAAESAVFAFGVERTSASETAADLTVSGTGWTKRGALLGTVASDATITMASKPMAAAGSSGQATFTTINTQTTNGEALQIVIPPGVTVTPEAPASFPGTLFDGAAVREGMWYVVGAGDTILPLDWAGMIHPGADSIEAMLAKPVFYCGHRGGSANWPEMSLQGYTQSALRGYDALELSLARTSDGVWFGLHDASLDRTSYGTGGGSGTTYVASTMTWAQVQTHDLLPATVAPVNTAHEPYMELEELLDIYLKSHVIFVDPKYANSSPLRTELIAILKNFPNWQSKIVAKYVPGNNNNGWLNDARAAGFVTNAMFYATDNFGTYHPQGDILGMQYNTTEAVWASIVNIGKPVMVHVCPNKAAVDFGILNGARGAMVSGVKQVPRVPGL